MGKKTYAMLPNGKIMNWIDVLSKYNLYHSEGISAHVEFDDYALTKKKLQGITVVIKNDDGDFVKAVKNKNGVWVESGNEDNDEENEEEVEEEYCEECGELVNDCECDRCKNCEKDEYNNDVHPWDEDEETYPKGKGTLFFHLCHEDDNSKISLYNSNSGNRLINIDPKGYYGLNLSSWKEYTLDPGKYLIIVKRNNVVILNKFAIIYKRKRTDIRDLDYINFKGDVNGTGKLNVTSINKETGISINKDFIGSCPKSLNLKPGNYTIEFWNYSDNRELKKLYKENSFTKHVNICESTTLNVDENYDDKEQERQKQEKIKKEKLEQEKLEQLREENIKRLEEQERIEKEKEHQEQEKLRLEQEKLQKERLKNEELYQETIENQSYVSDCNILPVGRFNKYGNGHGNGKKVTTRARLPNGEVLMWVKLLERYNLYHRPGRDASGEWFAYKSKDSEGRLPDVDRIDANGNLVPYIKSNGRKDPITQSEKLMIWDMTFNGKKDKCIACNDHEIAFDGFELGHNIPASKEGSNDPNNLFPICYRCNRFMGNRYTILEFMKKYFPKNGNVEKYFGETMDKSTKQWIKIKNWVNPRNL